MIKVKNTDNTWSIVSGAGSASIIEKTYAELKALRDAGTLVAGQQYRITDYQAYTSLGSTKSAEKPFDIIVTADSTSRLNLNARVCLHSGDTYFASCDLDAWEIKYSMEANATRWQWANPSATYTSITVNNVVYNRNSTKDYSLDNYSTEPIEAFGFTSSAGVTTYTDGINAAYKIIEAGELKNNAQTGDPEFDEYDEETQSLLYEGTYYKYTGKTYIIDGTTYYKVAYPDDETEFYGVKETFAEAKTLIDAGNTIQSYIIMADWENTETITATTKEYDSAFKGVIYYMKDEWGNEASFDFKGIQIINVKVDSATWTSYISKAYWVGNYVPKGSSLYGFKLGTETAYYYLFSNTADIDASLIGSCTKNIVNYLGTGVPLHRIYGSHNEIRGTSHYVTIIGSRNIVEHSGNVLLADSENEISYSLNITLQTYGRYNVIKRCLLVGAGALEQCFIAESSLIVVNKAYRCTIDTNCDIIFSAAGSFLNSTLSDVQGLYMDTTTGKLTYSTIMHCNGYSSSPIKISGTVENSKISNVLNLTISGSINFCDIKNISGSGTATIAGTVVKTTMDNCPDCNIASGASIDSSSFLDMNTLTVRANTTLVRGEFTGCKIIEIGDGSTTSSYDYLTINSCYKIYFYPVKASHNTLTSCYDTTFTSSLKNFYNNVATGARSLAVSTEATTDMGYYQISAGNYQGKTVNLAWSNYFSKVVYYDNSFTIQQKCVTGS